MLVAIQFQGAASASITAGLFGLLPTFEPVVVVDAQPREGGGLLSAQPGGPPYANPGGEAHVGRGT